MKVIDRNAKLKRRPTIYWWRLLTICALSLGGLWVIVRLFRVDFVNQPLLSVALTVSGAMAAMCIAVWSRPWWTRSYRTPRHLKAVKRELR